MNKKSVCLLICAVALVSAPACRTVGADAKNPKPKPSLTVIRPPVVEKESAFDGNEQNAGIKDYVKGKGFSITPTALARYNTLLARFGAGLVPPLSQNHGITLEDGNIFMTAEAMSQFVVLSEKAKSGE